MKSFRQKVLEITSKIPKGKTLTYKEVARKAGNPNASRAVGAILKTNFDSKITKLSDGSVLYDSKNQGKKINMIIGDVNYPLIFSCALHNKISSGVRTVIAKGKLFKALGSNINKIIPQNSMPAEEYFMLELMNFE